MRISHVRLLVPDVRECFLFYRDVMGLNVRYGDETTPFAEFQTGDINLALEPPMVDEPVTVIRNPNGMSVNDQVAVIFSVEDIDAVYEDLKGKGVAFVKEPYDETEWNMRIAYLRDPAGNLIELNQGI
ncbi:MAG TPA: VOC family protein [Bacillales bacterium]|nr:VOC family protein [Bacillales bacterium]